MAVYLEGQPLATASLGSMVQDRLGRQGLRATVRASPLGLVVTSLVESPHEAGSAVNQLFEAVFNPISDQDATAVRTGFRQKSIRRAESAAHAATAWCAGELVLPTGIPTPPPTPKQLDTWIGTLASDDLAFAAVGDEAMLSQTSAAVARLPQRKRIQSLAPLADWNPTEAWGIDESPGADGVLSVAVSGIDPAIAIAAADRLGQNTSLLALTMAATSPSWRTVGITATMRRGSACLQAQFHQDQSAPSVHTLRRSAAIALGELEHALGSVPRNDWALDRQVLTSSNPAQAAAVAAWQALATNQAKSSSDPVTHLGHYSGGVADSGNAPQFASADYLNPQSRIEEARLSVEPGQGRFWMLLASPCGTRREDRTSAGLGSLMVHSVALLGDGQFDTKIEPWVSPDAIGLLAHSAPRHPDETPGHLAERVAGALARALLAPQLPETEIASARQLLRRKLGPMKLPGYSLAISQASSSRPSQLEARGTWDNLASLSARQINQERRRWVAGKLRLAIIGNADESQLRIGQNRILTLLEGVRRGEALCPKIDPVVALSGRYLVEAPENQASSATVITPWPQTTPSARTVGQYTTVLLNRPGGWLDTSLVDPGLALTARASLVGGKHSSVLAVRLVAPKGRADAAVAQLRGLLGRIREGATSLDDLEWARLETAQARATQRLDPRARVVDLWSGKPPEPPVTLAELRSIHQTALGGGREVVVLSEPTR